MRRSRLVGPDMWEGGETDEPIDEEKGRKFTAKEIVEIVLQVMLCVLIILSLVAVIIGAVKSYDKDSLRRYNVRIDNVLNGEFITDASANRMDFKFKYNQTYAILSVNVYGPIPAITFSAGPLAFSLCGIVETCNGYVTPGRLDGSLSQVQPGNLAVRPFILAIRDAPTDYYIIVEVQGGIQYRYDIGPVLQ